MKPQVDLFSFVFLEEIEDTKKTFRNHLTFRTNARVGVIKIFPPLCSSDNLVTNLYPTGRKGTQTKIQLSRPNII